MHTAIDSLNHINQSSSAALASHGLPWPPIAESDLEQRLGCSGLSYTGFRLFE